MKVTFYEVTPLNGKGTLLDPATRWARKRKTELCSTITKMGNVWYMKQGGYVYLPININRIVEIDGYAVCGVPNSERFVVCKDGTSRMCYGFEDVVKYLKS